MSVKYKNKKSGVSFTVKTDSVAESVFLSHPDYEKVNTKKVSKTNTTEKKG